MEERSIRTTRRDASVTRREVAAAVRASRREILEPTEPSTVGREKIRDAVDTAKRRKGAAKIAITKATAREIRDSLGITPTDEDKARRAVKKARKDAGRKR